MKKSFIFVTVGGILLFLYLLMGCNTAESTSSSSSTGGGDGTRTYAGSDPKGDYIVIDFDTANSLLRRINFTTGETNGWFSYSTVPTTSSLANGFSILKKATILSNAGTNQYVLFSEFPSAACVYQMFIVTNSQTFTIGNPCYVVYRQALAQSDFYGKAYNWMKFTIDSTLSNSDMEAGFASFDNLAQTGQMYGAGYSRKRQTGQHLTNCGFNNINENSNVNVDGFSANSAAGSLAMWTGTVGDWTRAINMTGTASGAVILDFGTNCGGGSGLAIPQTTSAANPSTWWTTVGGTYFTLIYEYDKQNNESSIQPMKIVIGSGGSVKVYQFTNHTSDLAFFDETLTMLSNTTTNQSPATNYTLMQIMSNYSGNQNAASTVVQNAHQCMGSYMYTTNDIVLFTMFDPSGRFMGFTMFDDTGSDYKIRFGLGIKDTGYNDSF
jgi:hypothetical protein